MEGKLLESRTGAGWPRPGLCVRVPDGFVQTGFVGFHLQHVRHPEGRSRFLRPRCGWPSGWLPALRASFGENGPAVEMEPAGGFGPEHRQVAVAGSDEGQHEATVNLGAGSGEQDVGSGAACLGRNCTLPRCAADSGTLP